MASKQLSERARALAEVGRKHMRPLAIQGVSGLSFDRLLELADAVAHPPPTSSGPSPALLAAVEGVRAWIDTVQKAIAKEFPKSEVVAEEFALGKAVPADPEGIIAAARVVRKGAGMYSVNLLNRGVDGARVRHIEILERNLRLAMEADANRPDPVAQLNEAKALIAQIEAAAKEAFKENAAALEQFAIGEAAADNEDKTAPSAKKPRAKKAKATA